MALPRMGKRTAHKAMKVAPVPGSPKPPAAGHPGAPAQPGFRSKLTPVKTDRGEFSFKANRGAMR